MDIYRKFHAIAEYTFFSSVHGNFLKTDNMLHHKTSLNEFKMIEIMQSMFYEHNGKKLGVNNRKKFRKFTNMWKLNKYSLKTNKSRGNHKGN